jgi:hypothetical protein
MPTFSLHEQPEVFFSTTQTSRAIRTRLEKSEIRQLGPRLYTKNLTDDPETVARRNWSRIAAGSPPTVGGSIESRDCGSGRVRAMDPSTATRPGWAKTST